MNYKLNTSCGNTFTDVAKNAKEIAIEKQVIVEFDFNFSFASINLSKMIIPHVIKVADNEGYSNGIMTKNGIFEYVKRKESNEEFEKEILVIKEIV